VPTAVSGLRARGKGRNVRGRWTIVRLSSWKRGSLFMVSGHTDAARNAARPRFGGLHSRDPFGIVGMLGQKLVNACSGCRRELGIRDQRDCFVAGGVPGVRRTANSSSRGMARSRVIDSRCRDRHVRTPANREPFSRPGKHFYLTAMILAVCG
jgi:hypothetical protein